MNTNLTKKNIVLAIHEKVHVQNDQITINQIQEIVQLTLDTIVDALLEGRNVEIRNFGVFEIQHRKSRIGRNPNKPEKDVVIPAHDVVKFKPGKGLKDQMKARDLKKNKI